MSHIVSKVAVDIPSATNPTTRVLMLKGRFAKETEVNSVGYLAIALVCLKVVV